MTIRAAASVMTTAAMTTSNKHGARLLSNGVPDRQVVVTSADDAVDSPLASISPKYSILQHLCLVLCIYYLVRVFVTAVHE